MTVADLMAMPKIDAHAHLMGADRGREQELVEMLRARCMRWMSPCWLGDEELLRRLIELSAAVCARHPDRLSWATAFSLQGFGEPEWADRAMADVDRGLEAGAVGVKVWKNIGMDLREDGRYVMIDDPRFDAVLDYIQAQGLTLAAHIGEPRDCWLPLEQMTVEGDRSYFRAHPQYHGLARPEIPGYHEQISSRDRMLERHPGLRVVGCHLGSLEYDVGEIARRLDRFPNLAADVSARVCHLQVQDREAVRSFMLAYQDRLLYGTDHGVDLGATDQAGQVAGIGAAYDADARYFATAEVVEAPTVAPGYRCEGLDLPEGVLRKLYHDNAVRWYPRMVSTSLRLPPRFLPTQCAR